MTEGVASRAPQRCFSLAMELMLWQQTAVVPLLHSLAVQQMEMPRQKTDKIAKKLPLDKLRPKWFPHVSTLFIRNAIHEWWLHMTEHSHLLWKRKKAHLAIVPCQKQLLDDFSEKTWKSLRHFETCFEFFLNCMLQIHTCKALFQTIESCQPASMAMLAKLQPVGQNQDRIQGSDMLQRSLTIWKYTKHLQTSLNLFKLFQNVWTCLNHIWTFQHIKNK